MPVAETTAPNHTAALVYVELGYAVIPVHGNKVAAIKWKLYQRRKPTPTDLHRWFIDENYPGIAIVTGAISGLVVLDFDDPALFDQFKIRFSYLAETRTVQTRRGYHLYFHLPPHLRITSRKAPGVDLLSDGKYVIAPPSIIANAAYKVTRGGQPKTLATVDIQRIQCYLDTLTPRGTRDLGQSPNMPVSDHIRQAVETSQKLVSQPIASSDLIGLYRHLAEREGRNEALFKTSLRARDTGWSAAATIETLADIHTQQQPNRSHKIETPSQRSREAQRTIHSAFSRPPRPIEHPEPTQLPNTVREALFKLQQTATVRVIEGLRLKGIQSGAWFTETQARELLAGVVGNHSIRVALTAYLETQERLFTRLKTPSNHPLTPNGVATNQKEKSISKCFEINASKSKLNNLGRPTHYYQMPGNTELAAKLGVKLTRISDPLVENDLQSAKKTRQAVHREYIRRRPGQYPRTWLAARLGVSTTTEQRYNREIPIKVVPMYTLIPIFWWNLNRIPAGLDVPGLFLQDETGKKYPAQQSIARKLLSQGRRVSLLRREPNHYAYGERPPPMMTLSQEAATPQPQLRYDYPLPKAVGQGVKAPPPYRKDDPRPAARKPENPPSGPPQPTTKPAARHINKRTYRKPLQDANREALAQRMVTVIDAINPDNRLSQVNARRLANQYAPHLIKKALHRLQHDQTIRNHAGFLIVYLRSEAKALTC